MNTTPHNYKGDIFKNDLYAAYGMSDKSFTNQMNLILPALIKELPHLFTNWSTLKKLYPAHLTAIIAKIGEPYYPHIIYKTP